MNKQEYEIFADCRIRIYEGDSDYEDDVYAEVENLGVSTPEKPLKVRLFKPTEMGLIYLDDGSIKTMHKDWFFERCDYYGIKEFAKNEDKHYLALEYIWSGVEEGYYSDLPPKQKFEIESLMAAYLKAEFLGYNGRLFERPEPCPRISELVEFQHQMNHDLAISAKQQQSKNTEPEMER